MTRAGIVAGAVAASAVLAVVVALVGPFGTPPIGERDPGEPVAVAPTAVNAERAALAVLSSAEELQLGASDTGHATATSDEATLRLAWGCRGNRDDATWIDAASLNAGSIPANACVFDVDDLPRCPVCEPYEYEYEGEREVVEESAPPEEESDEPASPATESTPEEEVADATPEESPEPEPEPTEDPEEALARAAELARTDRIEALRVLFPTEPLLRVEVTAKTGEHPGESAFVWHIAYTISQGECEPIDASTEVLIDREIPLATGEEPRVEWIAAGDAVYGIVISTSAEAAKARVEQSLRELPNEYSLSIGGDSIPLEGIFHLVIDLDGIPPLVRPPLPELCDECCRT